MHEQKNTNQQKNQYSASSEREQAIYKGTAAEKKLRGLFL